MKFPNPPTWRHVIANALHLLHDRMMRCPFPTHSRYHYHERAWKIQQRYFR